MRTKHIVFGLFITTLIAACNNCQKGSGNVITSMRTTAPFTGVVSKGSFNVYITPAQTQEVKIVADDNIVSKIQTSVNDGILTIDFQTNSCFKNTGPINVYVYTPSIESIDLEGSGIVQSTSLLKSTNLNLILNGSGNMTITDSCSAATVSCNGSGIITLTGKAKDQTITLGGSGNINASGFGTENTTANLSGSGSISVYATKSLNANLSGSGSLFYYGNPTTVNKNQTGSGVIEGR